MSDYFKNKSANNSRLKVLLDKTPAHLKHEIENESNDETTALIIGRALHCIMLEGNKAFYDAFIISPKFDKRTKVGKEAFAEFEQLAGNKTILNESDAGLIFNLEFALKSNETVVDLLSTGEGEKELYGTLNGVNCKAKLDWYRNGIIVDLKTTENASARGFGNSCAKYHYDMQAAFYSDLARECGLDVQHFIFIVVEKTAPYLTSVFVVPEHVIENGRRKYQHALKIWQECHESNEWSGYEKGIQELSIPEWGIYNEQ